MADPADLTTLAAVRAYMQKGVAETAQDALIGQAITRASRLIMRETRREFRPMTDAAQRSFVYQGGGFVDLAPYDLRAATAVALRANRADTALTVESSNVTDYELRPQPAADGVYRWLYLRGAGWLDRKLYAGDALVKVTGNWGFEVVPPDVEQACIVTVMTWLRRDVSAFAATFTLDEGRIERPEALPSAVRGMLRTWRYPVMG